ncbi:MAG: hypothetical protein ACLTUL_11525 [Blautia faecis]
MTAYDIKLKQMNELAANTLGFYYTDEEQDDGSVISYRHDKPTLEESQVIYKNGVDGFFLSTDGGETWKAGLTPMGMQCLISCMQSVFRQNGSTQEV